MLISKPEQWSAYYWWLDDAKAAKFARTVDIHRKPGYDPVEMFIDMPTRSTPLNAGLVKGSHGYPADRPERRGVLVCSNADLVNPPGRGRLPTPTSPESSSAISASPAAAEAVFSNSALLKNRVPDRKPVRDSEEG